jgi:catechol 2,3-dioxygenase-like lactoylglutathione lyase family enzyme
MVMANSLVSGFKSGVLASERPDATAAFYREVLGLPLEEERHRGTERHWAGQVGAQHFAVHERDTFWLPGETVVSFTVEDLDRVLAHLAERNVEVIARRNIGPMKFVPLRDPDGRYVCCGTPWPQR